MKSKDIFYLVIEELKGLRDEYIEKARAKRQEACQYFEQQKTDKALMCSDDEEMYICKSQGVQKLSEEFLRFKTK